MEKIHDGLPIPYMHMLENYKLASENITEEQKSFHWDVFPKYYEKAIESIDAWRTFLRNPLSLGFNDALLNFDNTRWQKNKVYKGVDAWERKRQHDYRELINEIITDKNDRQKTLNLINLLFSICGPEFVLDNFQSDIGSPSKISFSMKSKNEKEKPNNFYCNCHDLGNIYYFWQISRTVDSLIKNDSPTFIEIGAGYGGIISKLKKRYPKSRCVLFDLPELSAVQTYYISSEFPNAKIFYYKDLLNVGNDLFSSNFDFLILPGVTFERLPSNYIDLIINMRSMMEMSSTIIKYYFDNIHRAIKNNGLFVCFNRYIKESSGEKIILKNYPFDKFWSIVISQTSIFQNHLHDLILKRKTEKDDFPIADRLKSLPPF